MTRIATLKMKVKVVSAERGDPYTLPYFWDKFVKWTYNNSDYCFFQLEKAMNYYGRKVAYKSFVIPNVFVQKNDVTTYFGERKKTIVSAGRFVAEKRFEILIKAFSRVFRKHTDYSLIIYGKGPFLSLYKELVNKYGISNNVFFPGYVTCVANSIREDGIFVLSSKYEGIPNTLIEALSIGIPCVSTNCSPGGPAFLLKNGRNGELIDVDDEDAMVNSLLKIIENPSYSKILSEKGHEILEEMTDNKIGSQWIKAFEIILNSKKNNSNI